LPAVDATVLEMTSEEQSGLPLVIRFPSDEEDARIKRFTVHRNYLGSIELFLAVLYGTGRDQAANLVTAQRALPAFQRIQRRATADERELRRLLGISWASELQLRLANIGGDVFLRYSNAWTPVQAYYAVYMSIHAWLSTAGMGHIDDHTGTLRAAVRHLVEARLLPHPWDVNCSGSPELGERAIAGAPANANIDAHFENLSAPSLGDFYPRLAKMLETTRDNRLQRNRREWLAQHKDFIAVAAGIIGIAVGFAAQTSISNIISGFFLMAEQPFVVNDVITVDATTGMVLSIDILSVKLRTFDNKFVRIPNETILKSEVTNVTRFPIRRVDINVGVAYKEDVNRVKEILLDIANKNPLCLQEPEPIVIFQGFGKSSIDFMLGVWAEKADWLALKNAIQEEIKKRFDREGIEIPFPHVTVYSGSASRPFRVEKIEDRR